MNTIKAEIFSGNTFVSSNVISLDIIKCVNRIPYAQLVIHGDDEEGKTAVDMSKQECFTPGQEIEIKLKTADGEMNFKGIVVKHTIKKTAYDSLLIIDIKDICHKLTLQRQSMLFTETDDATIIKDIAEAKGITEVKCSETTLNHKQIIQYYCTDWDFIVSRAEANGLIVCAQSGVLELKKPAPAAGAVTLTGIYEYELEADMSSQYKEIEGICWDIAEMKPGKETYTTQITPAKLESEHDFDKLATDMGGDKNTLQTVVHAEKEEMKAWAEAYLLKNRLSLLRGRISIDGNPNIALGDTVKIAEAGKIFNGMAVVSGIRHRITSEDWKTDIQCGLSNTWFYKNDDVMEKPAAGLIPGITGLQIGVVEAYPSDGDPDGFHRIKIRIPAVHETDSVIWARLIFPYAGDARGMFLVPEEGDEVVVGFFNDDPRHAVVLGSLYNGKTELPLEMTDKNNEKGLVTRSGIKMIFTDEEDKEKVEIATPAGNRVFFDDEVGITIDDVNENNITLDDNGMILEDKNGNNVTADDKGIVITDKNDNSLTFSNQGIEIKDANGNTITMGSAGIEIKNANGSKTALEAAGITVDGAGTTLTFKGSAINMN